MNLITLLIMFTGTSELKMGLYLDSTSLEVVALLTTICILLYFFSWYRYGYWWRQDVYHLPATFPYGNFRDFILRRKTLEENFSDIYNKLKGCRYGGGVYFGLKPLLVIRDVELTRSFFSEDDDDIANGQVVQPRGLHYSLANGKCHPQLHHEEKHIAVSQDLKDAMVLKVLRSARAIVASIEDSSDATVEINKLVSSYVSSVKASFANGSHIYCNEKKMFSDIGGGTFTSQFIQIVHSFIFPPRESKRFSQSEAHDKNVPEEKAHPPTVKNKEHCADGKMEGNDIFNPSLTVNFKKNESNQPDLFFFRTDNEAIEHAMNVFIRSLENFSSTMASTLHEVSAQTKIQSRLQEEIDETLGKSGDVTYSNILKLNYLQNVISGK